jgi:hypothetical protein
MAGALVTTSEFGEQANLAVYSSTSGGRTMTTILEPAPFAIELTRTRTGLEQLEALRDQRIGMAPC